MVKKFGASLYQWDDKKFAVWRAHLRDEMYGADEELGNPVVWFAMDLSDRDLLVAGVHTKREALDFIGVPEDMR